MALELWHSTVYLSVGERGGV